MAGVSLGTGLSSGIDYSAIIGQLMQIEARPQILLRNQLSSARTDAAVYRDLNTSFAALAAAAKNLTQATTWSAAKATSSVSTVTASSAAGATNGSLTFKVAQLAAAHSVLATKSWATSNEDFSLGSTLTIKSLDGSATFGKVDITSSDSGNASLADAVSSINKSGLGLSATAVNTGSGYRLQITSTTTGAATAFTISSDTTSSADYPLLTTGTDAKITIAGRADYTATSATNTFDGVLAGTTFTVSQLDVTATVTVATDPDTITNAVSAMVTAANTVLTKIGKYTDSSVGSTAALKGDYSLTSLASQVLTAVSSAVGGDGSAALAGLQLTRAGALTFDPAVFKTKLASDPVLVQRLFSGSTDVGADNVSGTVDDVLATDGLGARLQRLSQQINDSVNGRLTLLAKGRDTRADDLTKQIESWDLRLALRKTTLTAQFNALETALSALQNQASWLSSQINSLPSWSSSAK